MKNSFRHVPKSERKKILLLCDDIRMPSGIGHMAREIVTNSVQHFDWVNVGAGIKHPENGKFLDISEDVRKLSEVEDAEVKVIPFNGYGTPDLVRQLMQSEKPDAIMIFTDPRYWTWLFNIEREIRSRIPIIYLNIWDDLPAPLYNRDYYDSVDTLLGISKQTTLINQLVLGEKAENKIIEYVPHGVDHTVFRPVEEGTEEFDKLVAVKKDTFPEHDIDFIVFYNSRNIRRKSTSDLLLAYKYFCDKIGKERAKKCGLVLHTEPIFDAGTDLIALRDAICDKEYVNVFFSSQKLTPQQINYLYNMADVTVLPSSNEGWGLSLTESVMAGTMIIANMTGGMQDQMRVVDNEGNWFTPTADIPSNHRGTFKKHGEWAVPVYPRTHHLVGSPPTPYIFDDICSAEDIAEAIKTVYELSPEERKTRAHAGRDWMRSEEANMTAEAMTNSVIDAIDRTLETFKPRTQFELIKIQDLKPDLVPHKLTNY